MKKIFLFIITILMYIAGIISLVLVPFISTARLYILIVLIVFVTTFCSGKIVPNTKESEYIIEKKE
ncbi:hypothetical protein BG262_05795 [Floricoccus penangensis]|uniref:Uncharacterized protein n=1 Tax=Floricoccus penangensis TaxID=1859475 RepID=A0A9Q5JFE4_9LACT|nr:hypothetical protein [Floricoccus penangensis]OFI45996.1 hypothetical protein BG262_05795 [Floricoccus penangensis]